MTNKTAIEPGTPDRDPNTPSDEPLFLRAAREAGAKSGVSADFILAEDRRAAESPTFPSEECFHPEEAEWFLSAKIQLDESDDAGRALDEHLKREFEDRSAHLAGCVFCQAMLASMESVHTRREAFLEVVRQEAPYQEAIEFRSLPE